jgi:hypothetical protein
LILVAVAAASAGAMTGCGDDTQAADAASTSDDDGGAGDAAASTDGVVLVDRSALPTGDGPAPVTPCGDISCKQGQLCIPGCRAICFCDPAPPAGGSCQYGPCQCGGGGGCAPKPPPSTCQTSLPSNCMMTPKGIVCTCA